MIIAIDRLPYVRCPSIDDRADSSRVGVARSRACRGDFYLPTYPRTQKAREGDRQATGAQRESDARGEGNGDPRRRAARSGGGPRRAGSSTARSLQPQSSRTCLDAPWWLEIRARRCYFFRATTRPKGNARATGHCMQQVCIESTPSPQSLLPPPRPRDNLPSRK